MYVSNATDCGACSVSTVAAYAVADAVAAAENGRKGLGLTLELARPIQEEAPV